MLSIFPEYVIKLFPSISVDSVELVRSLIGWVQLLVGAREVLNKLTWDKRYSLVDYAVIFVHRGAIHDLKVVRASDITGMEKSFFVIEETMIPFHRIRAIRNIKNGEDIYARAGGVQFPLEQIEGHEALGDFEDIAHRQYQSDTRSAPIGEILSGARLSFPEDEPDSFGKRVADAAELELVELSFFKYDGSAEVSSKYQSILNLAENALLESALNVVSLHLPNINILSEHRVRELLTVFLPFCGRMNCRSVVVHPGRMSGSAPGRLQRDGAELIDILKKFSGELEQHNVTLSIETFPERNRVPSGATDTREFIEDLSNVYSIAYDTSHTTGDTDQVVGDILNNIDWINVFHFSNRNDDERHMPIFSSKGDLDFTKIIRAIRSSRFTGMIFLEYQPNKYRMLLERDLRMLRNMIHSQ